METQEITYRVKFLAYSVDYMGYINYVFERTSYCDEDFKYIMCVRFPNWNQSNFNIGDEGFVTVKYVRAGIDKWFDGKEFNDYKYTNMIFMKFVALKPIPENPKEITLD